MQEDLKDLEVDPIDVLSTDLSDIDIEVQIEATKNVPTVALAIGPEKSSVQLISAIDAACFPDLNEGHALSTSEGKLGLSEEVLMEVALVLNFSMIPLIGGQENILPMLKLLQRLAMFDEPVVRESAIDSILGIAKAIDVEYVEKHVLSVVIHLGKAARWASRAGAGDAIPRLYHYLESEKSKETCQGLVQKLTRDKMQMVRYGACCKVYQMLMPMGEQNIMELLNFVSPILKNLMTEQQNDFRCLVIQIVKTLLKVKGVELLDICEEYLEYMFIDSDWRIRKLLLSELMEMVDLAPANFVNDGLLPNFVNLFNDKDPLVRTNSLRMAPEFLAHEKLNLKKIQILFTNNTITQIVEDEVATVRDAASRAVPDILRTIFGSQATEEQKDFVVHVMEKFSNDDSGEVRANFLKGLENTLFSVGERIFADRILPLVTKLLEDPKWRVRSSILHHITLFAEMVKAGTMNEADFSKILEMCLKDPVGEARRLCVSRVTKLGNILEPRWITTNLLGVFKAEMSGQKTKFHVRAVAIRIAEALATSCSSVEHPDRKELLDAAVALMIQGIGDPISNVRLAGADALVKSIKAGGLGSYNADIRSALESRNDDEDADVKRLAVEGLSIL